MYSCILFWLVLCDGSPRGGTLALSALLVTVSSRWFAHAQQALPASHENAGTAATEGVSYPKRRSVRMLYEMTEEEALERAITFLEDALGYRLVGGGEGGGRSLERRTEPVASKPRSTAA